MGDFGAGAARWGREMSRARSSDFFDRLFTQQNLNMKNKELDWQMKQPPNVSLEKQLIGAVQRVQAGQGTPEDIALLKAKAAMEGPKTQYSHDPENPGILIANTMPNPLEALLSGTHSTGTFAPEYGPTAPSPDPVYQERILPEPRGTFDMLGGGDLGQGSNPAINTPYDQIMPTLQPDAGLDPNAIDDSTFDFAETMLAGNGGSALPPISPITANSQFGRMEGFKKNLDVSGDIITDTNKAQLDARKEIAVDKAKKANEMQAQRAESKYQDDIALPTMIDMLYYNLGTMQTPYAGTAQSLNRLTAPEKAQNMALMMQNRLDLAAPLAKQLGVNPTDKDFQSTLERIFNENEDGATRSKLIQNLIAKIERKNGALPDNYKQSLDLMVKAQDAINKGADPLKVQARIKQLMSSGE